MLWQGSGERCLHWSLAVTWEERAGDSCKQHIGNDSLVGGGEERRQLRQFSNQPKTQWMVMLLSEGGGEGGDGR
jgi:hypothetical protein